MSSGSKSVLSKRKTDSKLNVPNASTLAQQMQAHFSQIEDPRAERTRVHLLMDIIIIGIFSVIAGGQGWEDMENYGLSKLDWLQQFLTLANGIPSPDTFRRVFERINPKVFECCFQRWVQSLVDSMGVQVIPIDGKTLKGSYDREQKKSALHLVSAWASEHRLVLGQVKVSDKSNEITAIPALLELLDLKGSIITIDAMGTQTAIAAQIYNSDADYILALKANHPTLYGQIQTWFEQAQAVGFKGISFSYDQRVEKGHHRIERRQVLSVPICQLPPLYQQADWLGLKTIVMVIRVRQLWNKTTREVMFYLTSLESEAGKIGRAIRCHWGVENSLHWSLDVTFNEDACRVRTGHGPQNLALLRRIALNALNLEKSCKRSNRQKSNRAAMDNNYMLTILAACLSQHDDASLPACQ